MKSRSLRVRLLLGAAVAIFLALAAAWFVMTLLFERHIERRVHADLAREGMQLAANVTIGAEGAPLLRREPASCPSGAILRSPHFTGLAKWARVAPIRVVRGEKQWQPARTRERRS